MLAAARFGNGVETKQSQFRFYYKAQRKEHKQNVPDLIFDSIGKEYEYANFARMDRPWTLPSRVRCRGRNEAETGDSRGGGTELVSVRCMKGFRVWVFAVPSKIPRLRCS